MPCVLIRSGRKTVSLSLKPDGRVFIRGPYGFPAERAALVVKQNLPWILEKRRSLETAQTQFLLQGASVCLMGQTFVLQPGEKAGYGDGILFLPPIEDERAAVAAACQLLAEVVFAERTARFAARMGLLPRKVTIGRANSSWGSCKRDGSLRFSWKALFCGPQELDYLVVHELCHLVHFDHSDAFWRLVETQVPHWRECRARMAETARRIAAQGWGPY